MKNLYLKYAVLSLTVASTLAHAQSPAVAVVRPGGVAGSILGAPGDYQVQTYDRNVLENITGKVMIDRQNEDKQFVVDAVRRIEVQLQSLVDEVNSENGIVKLANKSISSGVTGIQLIDYLSVTQALQAKINSVDVQINGLFALPGALKSQENMTIKGDVSTVIPAPLKVELEKIQNFFTTQKNQALSQAANLKFLVILPNKVPLQVTGYTYRPEKNIYSADQIAQMRKDATRDAFIGTDLESQVDELTTLAVSDIMQTRRTFGTSQHYRFNLNKSGRDNTLERLANIFQARNYLRAIYGTQLGIIGIDWKKLPANLDIIFTGNTTILGALLANAIREENIISDQQDKIANALYSAETRNKEVFGEGVDLLSRVMSAYTFVTGYVQLAAINVYILELMKADVEFEYMLTSPGGLRAVREAYRARYYKTPEMEARSKAVAKTFSVELDSDDAEQDVTAYGAKQNFKSALFTATQALESVISKAEQARLRLIAIKQLEDGSGQGNNVKTRKDTL